MLPTCLVQSIRLLAAVIAKNAVGSSWRKTLGTREWSRVPAEEKHMCKEATLTLMMTGEGGTLAQENPRLEICFPQDATKLPSQCQPPTSNLRLSTSCQSPWIGLRPSCLYF